MALASPSLSIVQLQAVFGVSHVTIHAWRNTFLDFPEVGKRSPVALKKWARKHDKDIAKDPERVLSARKPSKLKRLANGRVTGARVASKRASH